MYQLFSYTVENLLGLLFNPFTSETSIRNKNHFSFFKEYLGDGGLQAKTIILENDYISKDFFSDYAAYYSLCFTKYPKFCKRIHFFNIEFDQAQFHSVILEHSDCIDLQKSYLGFIVVKPIPYKIIGFTLLKNYPSIEDGCAREYFGTRDYSVHIAGYKLKLNSLAFQEQDSVLSACATSAIWSTLQKAAEIDYSITVKTPYEITKEAGLMSTDGSRLFPNKNGLSIFQMCQAITSSGLVVEVRQFTGDMGIIIGAPNSYLKKLINAYSPIGLPLILVVQVPTSRGHGLHALAVSGFKSTSPEPVPARSEISWISDNIEKIYVHDDQWGPFARVEFSPTETLITNWTNRYNKPTFTKSLLIPVFPKIRLTYDDIEAVSIVLDSMLSDALNSIIIYDFYWDINVQFSETFKENISNSAISVELKSSILFESLPKYIWVASCFVGTIKVFDFIFDATEVANSCFIIHILSYDNAMKDFLKESLIANPGYVSMFKIPNGDLFYKFLIDNL